jgi:hypothetical protein
MIGFETDLDDLRKASKCVAAAGDAAETARAGLHGLDMPAAVGTDAVGTDAISTDYAGMNPVEHPPPTVFGDTLGMSAIAAACERHRAVVEAALVKLAYTTHEASDSLRQVADLYEQSDANSQAALLRAGGEAN